MVAFIVMASSFCSMRLPYPICSDLFLVTPDGVALGSVTALYFAANVAQKVLAKEET